MKNYAVISEFNPFHKGHQYLIEQCRQHGATHITAIMSGNFVQRGDVAIVSKHIRTQMALNNGVDLVLELPLPYALSSAQDFATCGVWTAYHTGSVDCLAFGSECGNIADLKHIANIMSRLEFALYWKKEMDKGISYPNAVKNTVRAFDSEYCDILDFPNNMLGVEYIKALMRINFCEITPVTFKRIGDEHNSNAIYSEITSASNIRKQILQQSDFENYVPENVYRTLCKSIENGEIASLDNNMRGMLCHLRSMTIKDFSRIANMNINEGLYYKIYQAVQHAVSIEDVIEMAKSKRYTYARLRRILLSAFLGVTEYFLCEPLPYIRVLGFNANGTEILKKMKKTASLPIVTKITNLPDNCPAFAQSLLELERNSTDIYYTFTKNIKRCGMEFINGVVVQK